MDQQQRHKCGDVREDGLIFWKYRHDRKNNEHWVTPYRFNVLRNKANVAWNIRNRKPENRIRDKEKQLVKRYGVTHGWYEEKLKQQGHRCAICCKEESAVFNGKVKKLSVDHCHRTGKVRELLCSRCNVAIGMLDDSIDRVAVVLEYLKRHS